MTQLVMTVIIIMMMTVLISTVMTLRAILHGNTVKQHDAPVHSTAIYQLYQAASNIIIAFDAWKFTAICEKIAHAAMARMAAQVRMG